MGILEECLITQEEQATWFGQTERDRIHSPSGQWLPLVAWRLNMEGDANYTYNSAFNMLELASQYVLSHYSCVFSKPQIVHAHFCTDFLLLSVLSVHMLTRLEVKKS